MAPQGDDGGDGRGSATSFQGEMREWQGIGGRLAVWVRAYDDRGMESTVVVDGKRLDLFEVKAGVHVRWVMGEAMEHWKARPHEGQI